MKLKLFAILLFSLAISCAHYQERLKEQLEPWIGKHPDKVVEQWGAPNSTYSMENGVKVLSYSLDRQVSRYSSFGYPAYRLGNSSYNESCKINFFTDNANKKIERYTTMGEAGDCIETLKDFPNKAN